jgi:hypothetical protein
MLDKIQMTKIFMVAGVVLIIVAIVMLMQPVVKSQESGKLIHPRTGKVYSYNPKQTGYICLGVGLGSVVAVGVLMRG